MIQNKEAMETKFNFNSQVCTSRSQSERLLALGLKKETADCYYWQETEPMHGEATGVWYLETLDTEDAQEHFEYLDKYFGVCLADDEEHYFIPAWCLHRLIEMMPTMIKRWNQEWELSINGAGVIYFRKDTTAIIEALAGNVYDNIISTIEWLIKEGYFNKAYLEE